MTSLHNPSEFPFVEIPILSFLFTALPGACGNFLIIFTIFFGIFWNLWQFNLFYYISILLYWETQPNFENYASHSCGTKQGTRSTGSTPSPHHFSRPKTMGPLWPLGQDKGSDSWGRGNNYKCGIKHREI